MTEAGTPIIEIRNVSEDHGGTQPLLIEELRCLATDRMTLSGLDAAAAETFVHLVTGAALPDTGEVRTAGHDTRAIATDTEWLTSLDRFGLVTTRAVLVDALSVEANMAMPLTLSVDPVPDEVRSVVHEVARVLGFAPERLASATGTLSPVDRVLVHLGRAFVPRPEMVLLEHPTAGLEAASERTRVGAALRALADIRQTGWLALSDDSAFSRAAGGARWSLTGSGAIERAGLWRRLFR